MLDLRRFRPRSGKNRYFVAPSLAIHGEADRDAPVYAMAPRELADALYAVIMAEPRIKVVDRTQDGLAMQVIQRSRVFRFPDTVDIEAIALNPQQSSVALYSRSRYGRRDFGVNRRRIEDWLDKLAAKIGRDKIVQPANAARPATA